MFVSNTVAIMNFGKESRKTLRGIETRFREKSRQHKRVKSELSRDERSRLNLFIYVFHRQYLKISISLVAGLSHLQAADIQTTSWRKASAFIVKLNLKPTAMESKKKCVIEVIILSSLPSWSFQALCFVSVFGFVNCISYGRIYLKKDRPHESTSVCSSTFVYVCEHVPHFVRESFKYLFHSSFDKIVRQVIRICSVFNSIRM